MSSKPRRRNGVYPQKVRCKATNRHGDQCHKWAMKGSVVCNKHGGAAPQVRRKAHERILMAQDDAASLLVRAMSDKRIPFAERRRCAEFLLTYDTRNEIKLTLAKWEENIEGLLVDVGGDDIVDAELVDEPHGIAPIDYDWANPKMLSLVDDPPTSPRVGPRKRS